MRYPVVVVKEPNRTPIHLSVREPIEIGRECAGLIVADPLVSRRHLEIAPVGGAVTVRDLGSSNGSTLDGAPLTDAAPLREGSVLQFGDVTVELVVDRERANDTIEARSTAIGAAADTTTVRPAGRFDPRMTTIEVIASSVTSDEVSAAKSSIDQGTLTIVFSDIESSTQRNVELGDQAWLDLLTTHNEIIRANLERFGGTEIKNQGDGFMLSFPSARNAIRCTIGVQQDLADLEVREPDRALSIRVGIHTGEVLVDDGDLFGTHVVIAARVANLAHGREILVSQLTREIVAARGDVVFGTAREVELKGIGTQLVHPLDWSEQLRD